MRGNRRVDTRPERAVRSLLWRRGLRFRKDLRLRLPTGASARPDIVFPRARLAVFVDGCYWHGCPQHARLPAVNVDYWRPKIEGNVARDRRADAALADAGWTVLRVWEHEDVEAAAERIAVLWRELRAAPARSSAGPAGPGR
jgi:DNA mismatch endonuclease, patch repair protein